MTEVESIENVLKRPFWSLKDICRIYGITYRQVLRIMSLPGAPQRHGTQRIQRFPQQKVRSFMYDLGRSNVKERMGEDAK